MFLFWGGMVGFGWMEENKKSGRGSDVRAMSLGGSVVARHSQVGTYVA